ncbi:saccharopine dehydrogenase [Alteromonas pelagimontana]|uniref:Saccharopine dehydrogenase n=1 Tax=Alteromonas pelagimontana TaxID=1858656 RepID=A0A6M4MGJ3_9ALTE|nr:saccharopine dehydrogenase NADP-binding domain-containing protein [Alteromonas pelagimontana]QJR82193.1 saccharopine dehydrogenase [Alteromonas pelagimontana]
MEKLDIVVYGATSFIGQIIARFMAKTPKTSAIRWAIAGRDKVKLRHLADSLASFLPAPPPVLIADSDDPASLHAMCEQTKVILTTVGPFATFGEPLVKACVANGTDYVDLTGEPQWIAKMLSRYEDKAKQSGARIVHSCGFDSVPSDLGVYYLQQESQRLFSEPCQHVYMRVKRMRGGISGGTVASMLTLFTELRHNKKARAAVATPFALCPAHFRPSVRQPSLKRAKYDHYTGRWIAPFIMSAINTRIVHRSNALLNAEYCEDFTYQEAMVTGAGLKGALRAWGYTFAIGAFALAASIPPARKVLLERWLPQSGEGPSEKARNKGFFDIWFYGETISGKRLTARVTGDKDPGYGSSSQIISEVAHVLATDHVVRRLPGGFYTPASCFKSALFEPLCESAGITFEIIPAPSLPIR